MMNTFGSFELPERIHFIEPLPRYIDPVLTSLNGSWIKKGQMVRIYVNLQNFIIHYW